MDNIQSIKYLLSAKKDEQCGITINTVGTQTIEKDYVSYPPAEKQMILLRPGVWHSYTPDQKPF